MKTAVSIRCLLAILFVSHMVPAALFAAGHLNILIYDRAHVGLKTLNQAEQLASGILASAGVEAQWTAAPVVDGEAVLKHVSVMGERCRQSLDSTTIKAEILPHAPSGLSSETLGYTLLCGYPGIQITIYEDRVDMVSRTDLAAFYRVLGHAMAHEIGHVLLRTRVHENDGLMKGIWTRRDWQRAAVEMIAFTRAQAKTISQEMRRVESQEMLTVQSAAIQAWPRTR